MWQAQHHTDSCFWVVIVTDTLLIKLVRDKRFFELPVPKFQQRGCRYRRGQSETSYSGMKVIWTSHTTAGGSYLGCRDTVFSSTIQQCVCVPGMCGSSSPVGIFHWSTCSLRALTSSMSPGTLQIKCHRIFTLPALFLCYIVVLHKECENQKHKDVQELHLRHAERRYNTHNLLTT